MQFLQQTLGVITMTLVCQSYKYSGVLLVERAMMVAWENNGQNQLICKLTFPIKLSQSQVECLIL